MSDTKTIYVAYTNTDCTEGRGQEIAFAVSECESTVIRLGSKRYIQGSNCPIEQRQAVKIENRWYVPMDCVPFQQPTIDDRKHEARLIAEKELKAKKDEALQRAKDLGLSAEDLKILQGQS